MAPYRWFTKGKYHYAEPERFTAAEARERRLVNLLEREQRFREVPNFVTVLDRQRSAAALSRVAKNIVNEDAGRPVKDRRRYGPTAASIAARLAGIHSELDWNDATKRKQYRLLRQAQSNRAKVQPTGSDKRRYDPTGAWAATSSGTSARTTGVTRALFGASWSPRFVNPTQVIPCVQRLVRREVMFAKKKAGVGYHTRKRRNAFSGVPC